MPVFVAGASGALGSRLVPQLIDAGHEVIGTNRLRTEGTDALLAASREAGVRRFVAQSFAPYLYARQGGADQDRGRSCR